VDIRRSPPVRHCQQIQHRQYLGIMDHQSARTIQFLY
jgi:hypothetical protein